VSCGLHDVARLEASGVPVAFLVTTAFVTSVDEQLPLLGLAGYRPVWVPHPVAPLSEEALRPIAAGAAAAVEASLTGQPVPPPPAADVGADRAADCGDVACAVDLVERGG
jgi:hypothetical protein